MAEMSQQSSTLEGVTLEGNDFASLLNKEFKPKTDQVMAPTNSLFQRMASVSIRVKGKVTTNAASNCTVLADRTSQA